MINNGHQDPWLSPTRLCFCDKIVKVGGMQRRIYPSGSPEASPVAPMTSKKIVFFGWWGHIPTKPKFGTGGMLEWWYVGIKYSLGEMLLLHFPAFLLRISYQWPFRSWIEKIK